MFLYLGFQFTYVLEHPRNYNPHTFGPYDLCEELTENPKIVQQIINEMYFEGKDCDGVTKVMQIFSS